MSAGDQIVGVPMTLEEGIKDRLGAVAAERDSNLNAIAVAIIAEAFRYRYEPSGIKSSGFGGSDRICLDMPLALRTKINVRSASENKRRQVLLNEIFRDYLDGIGRAAAA